MALPARAGGSRRSDQIPVFDPRPDIEVQRTALLAAIGSVLDSGRFILGPQVEAIEAEVAAYLGTAHAVGVNSGTDALVIALRALEAGRGDEVVTPSFTFFATPEAVTMVGATPVFVDIDPATFTIGPAASMRRSRNGRRRSSLCICWAGRRHGRGPQVAGMTWPWSRTWRRRWVAPPPAASSAPSATRLPSFFSSPRTSGVRDGGRSSRTRHDRRAGAKPDPRVGEECERTSGTTSARRAPGRDPSSVPRAP